MQEVNAVLISQMRKEPQEYNYNCPKKSFNRHDTERMCSFLKSLVAFMTGIYLSYLVLLFVLNPEFVLKGQLKVVKWLPANLLQSCMFCFYVEIH